MKKLILAILMPVTLLVTGPGSIALAGEMTPASVALDGMDMSAYGSNTQNQELKASAPQANDGAGQPGIDIVSESLQYHSKVNPQLTGPSPLMNQAMQTGVLNGQITQSNYGPAAAFNQSNMMMNSYQQTMPSSTPMQYQSQMPGMTQPSMMNQYQNYGMQQALNSENMKKAIGVVGAAALMGVFIKNGGLGGVTRSMGWDNKRHVRGASIGGY